MPPIWRAAALAAGVGMEEIEEESGPLEAFIAGAIADPADGGDLLTEADD